MLRIFEMMLTCRYSFTDLSYVTRMNMPLELGLLLALGKPTFVMSRKQYGALQFVSDLNFTDIFYHRGSVNRLIEGLSHWIEGTCEEPRVAVELLIQRYRRVRRLRKAAGANFDRLTPQEIVEFLRQTEVAFAMELTPGQGGRGV